ncbi:MAG: ABC transporter ATP-binding protein [Actinomycetes bacterium]
MTKIDYVNVSKKYGQEIALRDFSLNVASGELVSILGPSGCGKTTALRILAGFIAPTSGQVLVDGKDVTPIPAEKRGFGMVFQSYSLFPNMTTSQNIEFALKLRKVDSSARVVKIRELLELTNMAEHADKFPHQLSGGQQQRVALARALATEPPILLLDEPLSALDAKVRDQLRDEIRGLQKRLGITTVFVTHDQQEAMAISDRVAVMQSGVVVQSGSPQDLYRNPKNAFVASFVGTTNRLPAIKNGLHWTILGNAVEGPVDGTRGIAYVRPEDIELVSGGQGVIEQASFLGSFVRVTAKVDGQRIVADLPISRAESLSQGLGVSVVIADRNPLIELES